KEPYNHGIALLKAVTKLRNSQSKHPMPWIQKFNKTFSTVISQSFSEHLRQLLIATDSRHLTKFLTSLKPD